MKVLLTGITGFVGQNLMPMLLKECPHDGFLTMSLDVKEAEDKYPSALYGNFSHVGINDLKLLKSLIRMSQYIWLRLQQPVTIRRLLYR